MMPSASLAHGLQKENAAGVAVKLTGD